MSSVVERSVSMMLGLAYGDALGARYEGFHLHLPHKSVRMGRGILAWRRPGWWTDDTDMALGILLALQESTSDIAILERTLALWLEWNRRSNPLDAGMNTWRVLHSLQKSPGGAPEALEVSRQQLQYRHRGGGNGAIMRTAPVALVHPDDPLKTFSLAQELCALTHPQEEALEAAGIWSVLCQQAIVTSHLQVDAALELVRRPDVWKKRLEDVKRPGRNGPAGWAPTTLLDALYCVRQGQEAGDNPLSVYDTGVRIAVASGVDPDTTGAVTGALLGALTGADIHALPQASQVHGGRWTGTTLTLHDLENYTRNAFSSAH